MPAASFLTRYQRPFMLVGLGMNIPGILVMLFILYRERQKLLPSIGSLWFLGKQMNYQGV